MSFLHDVNAILAELNEPDYLCVTEAEAIRLVWFVIRDERCILEEEALAIQTFKQLFPDFKAKRRLH